MMMQLEKHTESLEMLECPHLTRKLRVVCRCDCSVMCKGTIYAKGEAGRARAIRARRVWLMGAG